MGVGSYTRSFSCFWNITNFAVKGMFEIRVLQVAMSLARAGVKMASFFAGKVFRPVSRLTRWFVDNIDRVEWRSFGIRLGIGLELLC